MSIKGYPTTQKLANNTPGQSDFVTVQSQDNGLRRALDVVGRFAFRVNSDKIPRVAGANTGNPGSAGGTVIVDASTPARVGDFVRFESGLAQYLEIPIIAVSTNSFTLGARLDTAVLPASGDSFYIMRYAMQRVDETGSQLVAVTPSPEAYSEKSSGVTADTTVFLDLDTPANSKALPVRQIQANGSPVNVATEAKQDSIITQLTNLNAVDFATETTLAAVLADTTSLDGKDFATETTLAAAKADLDTLAAVDFATETTLSDILLDTGSLVTKDFATETTLAALNTKVTAVDTGAVTISTALPAGNNNIGDVDVASLPSIPAGNNNIGDVDVASLPVAFNAGAASATTQRVVIVTDQTTIPTSEIASGTATVTSVASNASSVQLLASNASRLNATFYNDSTQIAYLKLGTTASSSDYTIQMAAGSYYELPVGKIYTGRIDAIWASANGNMRITELT